MTKAFTLFWQGCLTFNLVSIFYSKQKTLYQDAKLLLKDELEFIESIAVNYNLVHFCIAEYNRFCKQLFNVPHITVSTWHSVVIDRVLQCSALLGLNIK